MIQRMTRPALRVDQIDHVEMYVPDVNEAARWYESVLGLEILKGFEDWNRDGHGPLMISSDGGGTKLALFRGRAQGADAPVGLRRIAFRVGGEAFVAFVRSLVAVELFDHTRRRIGPDDAVDHGRAFSIYFADSWGNRLEVTTYDSDAVRAELARREEQP